MCIVKIWNYHCGLVVMHVASTCMEVWKTRHGQYKQLTHRGWNWRHHPACSLGSFWTRTSVFNSFLSRCHGFKLEVISITCFNMYRFFMWIPRAGSVVSWSYCVCIWDGVITGDSHRGAPKGRGLPGCSPSPTKSKFKTTEFLRHNIKHFTWFTHQLKSSTEWPVH